MESDNALQLSHDVEVQDNLLSLLSSSFSFFLFSSLHQSISHEPMISWAIQFLPTSREFFAHEVSDKNHGG
jgi:hypothetical protein